MFSDEILTKIFSRKEIQKFDLQTQSEIVHTIEDVLEEVNQNADKSVSDTTGE